MYIAYLYLSLIVVFIFAFSELETVECYWIFIASKILDWYLEIVSYINITDLILISVLCSFKFLKSQSCILK